MFFGSFELVGVVFEFGVFFCWVVYVVVGDFFRGGIMFFVVEDRY